MSPYLAAAVAVGLALNLSGVLAQDKGPHRSADRSLEKHLTFTPADVQWKPGPASFETGSEFAVLEGDPAEQGVFTMETGVREQLLLMKV